MDFTGRIILNEITYAKIRKWFMKKKCRYEVFLFFYRVLPLFVIAAYSALIIFLLSEHDIRVIKVTVIPATLFLIVSILRKIIDRPRPYAVLNIEPLVKRDKMGESFPSRHVLSVSIIAMAFLYINIWYGICMSVIAVMIAFTRVLSGVHFIRDVVWAAVISYVAGGIAFLIF